MSEADRAECLRPAQSCFHLRTAEGNKPFLLLPCYVEDSPDCTIFMGVSVSFSNKCVRASSIICSLSRGIFDTFLFLIFVISTWRRGTRILKILNRWSASSLDPEFPWRVWELYTYRLLEIFCLVVNVGGSFWIVKQDFMKIIYFLKYPTSFAFCDCKTQSKQTHLHGNIFGTKFSALYTGKRTTITLN